MRSAIKHLAGLFAVAALILVVAPAPRAQALSLATPGIASSHDAGAFGAASEVHWRRYPHAHRYYYGRHYHPYWRRHYYHPYRYGYRHHYYHHYYHHRRYY